MPAPVVRGSPLQLDFTAGAPPAIPDAFTLLKDRTYGRAQFLILRKK
jgi:hypothetical protein